MSLLDHERPRHHRVGRLRRRRVLRQRRDPRDRERPSGAPLPRPIGRSTRRASTSSPAASTCTRTSTCRSAAPRPPTTSRRGPSRRRSAARPASSTSRFSIAASTMRHALDDWRKRADGKAVIDYGFHMIVTELEDAGLGDMDRMVRDEGITSFKLFMAYPGVFMVDDQTIFRALRRTGENGGLVCMHAENGGVIDELVKEALRKGADRAEVSRADASAHAPKGKPPAARSRSPRWRACPSTSSTCRPRTRSRRCAQARDMGLPAYAETCPQYLFLSVRQLRGAGIRRREVRDVAAASGEVAPGRALEGAREKRPAGDLDRPLPVLHGGAEGARARTTSARSRTARPASRPG